MDERLGRAQYDTVWFLRVGRTDRQHRRQTSTERASPGRKSLIGEGSGPILSSADRKFEIALQILIERCEVLARDCGGKWRVRKRVVTFYLQGHPTLPD